MKQRTQNLLEFHFKGLNMDRVEKIEFAFSQRVGESPLKVETYPGENTILTSSNSVGVFWLAGETELFEAGSSFFADTRITLNDTIFQPETNVVKLTMKPTLFEKG